MPALDGEGQHGPLPQNLNKDTASMSCHLSTASLSLAPPVRTPTSISTWPWQMGGLQAKHTVQENPQALRVES